MPVAKSKYLKPSAKFDSHIELSGSFRKLPLGKNMGNTSFNEVIDVLVKLRRKTSIHPVVKSIGSGKNKPLTPEAFDRRFGASNADIELVIAFARQYDLTVLQTSVSKRSVILRASVQNFSKAFHVNLADFVLGTGIRYRGRSGAILIPEILKDIITGVFGLDDRSQARPMFHFLKKEGGLVHPQAAGISYNPNNVAKAYKYPSDVNGDGECIALIELGGGFRQTDMINYFSKIGIPLPVITAQSVDAAHNAPSTADSADGEVALDIEVAGAVAPGAKIIVYFAPNTDKGFLDAISTAIHDKENNPSVISISWGSAESQWTEQALQNYNETFMSAAALGITITVAAGDSGSSDGQNDGKAHVDFPASSPYALACGGTHLIKDS